ncbi:MAG TPA: hypothetical protein VK892_14995, partial [Pyrinomonadaceae bacterium]|nr:hypothetical protein [Pyrinomonadaceae bacterium]
MNSEELERSLKTEFESYLKSVLVDMRQEISGFQEKFEAELEKHKSQLDELFRDFSSRLESDRELDEGFKETVVEHLRLARDEGARITAEAISEAEKMKEEPEPMPADYSAVRDAINEISTQESQAEILKSLVNQAAQFTSRGAFFIIKNDYFVGWRVFGKEEQGDEKAIREVFFPVSASTVLGESVRSLTAAEGSYGTFEEDKLYLDKLDFGQPEQMHAIPLVARGRGVAVLYADKGRENGNVDVEALETLVRVAGLTVELLAASRNAKEQHSEVSQKTEPV